MLSILFWVIYRLHRPQWNTLFWKRAPATTVDNIPCTLFWQGQLFSVDTLLIKVSRLLYHQMNYIHIYCSAGVKNVWETYLKFRARLATTVLTYLLFVLMTQHKPYFVRESQLVHLAFQSVARSQWKCLCLGVCVPGLTVAKHRQSRDILIGFQDLYCCGNNQ